MADGRLELYLVPASPETHTVEARWVVDASGVAAVLSRQQGWWRANTAHPTTAVWSRWRGVRDWDGYELAQKFPKWAQACYGMRGTATNHLVGDGDLEQLPDPLEQHRREHGAIRPRPGRGHQVGRFFSQLGICQPSRARPAESASGFVS